MERNDNQVDHQAENQAQEGDYAQLAARIAELEHAMRELGKFLDTVIIFQRL